MGKRKIGIMQTSLIVNLNISKLRLLKSLTLSLF